MDPSFRVSLARRDRRSQARFYLGAALVVVAVVASVWLAAFDLRSQRRLVREVDRGLRADAVLFAGRLEQLASGILYDEYLQAVLEPGSMQAVIGSTGEAPIPTTGDDPVPGLASIVQYAFSVDFDRDVIRIDGSATETQSERLLEWAREQRTVAEGAGYRGQLGIGEERVHLVARVQLDAEGVRRGMRGVVVNPSAMAGAVLPQAFSRLVASMPPDASERALLETVFAMRVESADTLVRLVSLGDGIQWTAVSTHEQPFTLEGLVPGWTVRVDYLNELKASGRRRILANLIPLVIVIMGLVYVSRIAIHEMELGSLKSAFVSNASHELKTPLTKIQFFNEMLEGIPPDDLEKRSRYHGVIAHECKRLRLLVDNVLDLSRIEDGRLHYQFKSMPIDELVNEVVETISVMYEDDGYEVKLEASAGLPKVDLDPQAIKQVLINLLDNAIKFSDPHTIRVEVSRLRRRGVPHVAVSVTDRGRGIPRESLPHLFEEFYRVPDGSGKPTTGTGLGLALARQIVHGHGGELEVESALGRGSRFTMLLPVRRHKEGRSK